MVRIIEGRGLPRSFVRLGTYRFRAKRVHFNIFDGPRPGSQDQNLALTVAYVPHSLDSGYVSGFGLGFKGPARGGSNPLSKVAIMNSRWELEPCLPLSEGDVANSRTILDVLFQYRDWSASRGRERDKPLPFQ